MCGQRGSCWILPRMDLFISFDLLMPFLIYSSYMHGEIDEFSWPILFSLLTVLIPQVGLENDYEKRDILYFPSFLFYLFCAFFTVSSLWLITFKIIFSPSLCVFSPFFKFFFFRFCFTGNCILANLLQQARGMVVNDTENQVGYPQRTNQNWLILILPRLCNFLKEICERMRMEKQCQ